MIAVKKEDKKSNVIAITFFTFGLNFSEEYEPYGGEGFESSTNEPKAFFGVGAGFYLVVGFEFSMGWDLIELKDRLKKIWG